MTATALPPFVQGLNSLLHKEPISTIFYGLYWSLVFTVSAPVVITYLLFSTFIKVLQWLFLNKKSGGSACHPKAVQEFKLAVVITGCDSGFGKELAFWAADAGYTVFAGCLKEESHKQFEMSLKIHAVQMDITSDSQVEGVAEKVSKWLNETAPAKKHVLHALVNNAGVGVGGEVDWIPLSDFQLCMDVNYLGMVRCCKAFLPLFKSQAAQRAYHRRARILNVTSMAGLVSGGSGLSAYHASKFAAQAFTTCLRLELANFDIAVCAICPSFHGTPLVSSMPAYANKTWENLPPDIKDEYGQDYFERATYLSVDIPHTFTWKASVAVEKIIECLTAETPPAELLIGTDGRFGLAILRMLPAWASDRVMTALPRPVPAVMKQSSRD